MSRAIHLHIERIVLHGLEVARPERLVLALQSALAERIARDGLPAGWQGDRAVLNLGAVRLASAEPEAMAEALAGALLAPPATGGGR